MITLSGLFLQFEGVNRNRIIIKFRRFDDHLFIAN
jgi:hypothetical protein